MIPIPSRATPQQKQTIDLLLGYLAAARCWPGADGQTLEDALLSYPEAAAAGQVPGCDELLGTHPGLGDALRQLLALPDSSHLACGLEAD